MKYDVVIIGAGPGGIFSAYELMKQNNDLKIAVFEAGNPLSKRHCPIDGDKVKTCIKCKTCAIMSGFGGAGAFSDGKYNMTNDFGGTLYEYGGVSRCLSMGGGARRCQHDDESSRKQPGAFAGVCRKNRLCAGGAFLWRTARFSGAISQAAGLDGRAFVLCGRAVSSVLVCLGNAD